MKSIAQAFIKAKKEFSPAIKNAVNGHLRNKYADLSSCIDAVDDALLNNGIAMYQETFEDQTGVTVETVMIHESGESIRFGKLHVPASKQDPQGYGSALTYARRYSLMSACGIAPEDDDGNAASNQKQSQQRAPAQAAAPAKLNAKQIEHIKSLIEETASDLPAFMQWISKGAGYECKTLAEAPAGCYSHAIKQLEAKKANP